jgi:sugar lactone lactonase YvrE
MKKVVVRCLVAMALLVFAGALALKVRYGGATMPFPDRSTAPLIAQPVIESVATLEEAPGNVAVGPDGRIFFNFHPEGRPALKVVEWKDGRAVPYPDERAQSELFMAPFSLRIDRQGRLWSLDTGFHGVRRPRLLAFDLGSGALVHRWDMPRDVAGIGSFAQDFEVSPDGRWIYIADIGMVARKPAIIVYDTRARRGRRVLERDRSTLEQPFTIDSRGRTMSLLGGLYKMHPAVDSIALDDAGQWLYYGPTSGPTLYRVRTADLENASLSAAEVSRRVETFGPKPQTDGITIDHDGNLYMTDVEHGALSILTADRKLSTLIRDPRFRWLDGLSFAPGGWLYAADSDIPDIVMRSKSHIRASAPFHVWRMRVGHEGTPGR